MFNFVLVRHATVVSNTIHEKVNLMHKLEESVSTFKSIPECDSASLVYIIDELSELHRITGNQFNRFLALAGSYSL